LKRNRNRNRNRNSKKDRNSRLRDSNRYRKKTVIYLSIFKEAEANFHYLKGEELRIEKKCHDPSSDLSVAFIYL